ncbi:hypothetical protein [Erwinia amylovora]
MCIRDRRWKAPCWTGWSRPVSYTHLDVYKRQALESTLLDRVVKACLLYTSRCV